MAGMRTVLDIGLTTAPADNSSSWSVRIGEGSTFLSTRRPSAGHTQFCHAESGSRQRLQMPRPRGWRASAAIKDAAAAREQMAGYHAALAASGHNAETIGSPRNGRRSARRCAWRRRTNRRDRRLRLSSARTRAARARNPDDMVCRTPDTVTRKMRAFRRIRRGTDDLRVPHRPRNPVQPSAAASACSRKRLSQGCGREEMLLLPAQDGIQTVATTPPN